MRNGGPVEPGVIDALQEVIADAAATGASLHVVHITSMGLRETPLCLDLIAGARKRGLDVTTEAYPYTAGMTDIGSAIFSEGWQQRQGGISFGDLQWAATGERLTAESFARYRKQGGMVAVHSIPEDIVRLAMANPHGDDRQRRHSGPRQGPSAGRGNLLPRAGPLCARGARLSLMDAVRKMTVMPADRAGDQNQGPPGGGRGRRCGGLRSGERHRSRHLRESRSILDWDGLCASERRPGGQQRGVGGGGGARQGTSQKKRTPGLAGQESSG